MSAFSQNNRRFTHRPKPTRPHAEVGEAWTFGRRAVIELLRSGLKVKEVLLLRSGEGETFAEVRSEAEARGIRVVFEDRFTFDRRFQGGRHQGVAAAYYPGNEPSLEGLYAKAVSEKMPVVFLDGVEDPQNVGAVIRSAEVFGAAGVVIPTRRSATVTPTAVKASAGAALRLSVVTVVNLADALRKARSAGIWLYGLDMGGAK